MAGPAAVATGSTLTAASLAALGGAAATAAAGAGGGGAAGRRLNDTHVLDMFTGPAWEQLDDGAWANNLMWLKQVRCQPSLWHGTTRGVCMICQEVERGAASPRRCMT